MTPDNTDDTRNDNQLPTANTTPMNLQSEPGPTDISIPAPGDVIEAGNSTDAPRADSPETPDAVMNDETGQVESLVQPLAEDNQTPFSPPTDTASGQLDPTHQATDNATDIDSQQVYDEGLAGAAEASEPNKDNSVVDYNPEEDTRTA